MLYTETVEPRAFSVLNQLMKIPELKDFSLVGGTALSLLYGHRKSVDLDLFSSKSFDNTIVVKVLEKNLKNLSLTGQQIRTSAFLVLWMK